MLISINPQDAVKSSNFSIKDGDALLKTLRAATYDYNGKREPVTVLRAEFIYNEEAIYGYYTCGKSLIPSADGKGFESISENVTGFPDNCNAFMFVASLVNAGFPTDKLGKDLSIVDNTMVHVNSVPAPERDYGTTAVKDRSIMIITKINIYPWDKKRGKGSKNGKATTSAAANTATADSDNDDNGVDIIAIDALMSALKENPDGIKKASIIPATIKFLSEGPERTPVLQRLLSDDFLKTCQGWLYEGGVIKKI